MGWLADALIDALICQTLEGLVGLDRGAPVHARVQDVIGDCSMLWVWGGHGDRHFHHSGKATFRATILHGSITFFMMRPRNTTRIDFSIENKTQHGQKQNMTANKCFSAPGRWSAAVRSARSAILVETVRIESHSHGQDCGPAVRETCPGQH